MNKVIELSRVFYSMVKLSISDIGVNPEYVDKQFLFAIVLLMLNVISHFVTYLTKSWLTKPIFSTASLIVVVLYYGVYFLVKKGVK